MTGNTETLTYDIAKTDQAVVEAFGDRMVDTLNSGALALMLSVGHRTGLFDTMAEMPAATSVQIAEKAGGDVPYERFERFHEVMAEDSGQSVVPALETDILPLVPGLIERLERGIRVLDVGCGRGRALNKLARLFPNSQFTGYDISEDAVRYASQEARALGNDNTAFQVFDVSDLEHSDRDHPIGPLLYTVSCMHCMTVSLAQGGEGLGAMWGREKALEYFREAGFRKIDVRELAHDFQNYWYVCRP